MSDADINRQPQTVDLDSRPPRLVVTVGRLGSTSTWVFNVVRELMQAAVGAEHMLALHAEDAAGVLAEAAGRQVVLKSHHGGPGRDQLLWLARAPVRLGLRDPRDAAVSLAQCFRMPLTAAVQGLRRDCALAIRLADAAIAPLRIPVDTTDMLFARYRTGTVRAFRRRARIG